MSPRAKINQELETKEFLKLKTMHPQPFRRHGLRPKVQSFTVVDDNKGGLADNLTVSKHSKFCRFSQSHDVGYKHAYCQRSCAMKIRQRSDTKRLSCHERFQAKAPHNTTQFLINDHESSIWWSDWSGWDSNWIISDQVWYHWRSFVQGISTHSPTLMIGTGFSGGGIHVSSSNCRSLNDLPIMMWWRGRSQLPDWSFILGNQEVKFRP